MTLVLTEEQELLQQTARDFVREKSPVKAFRSLRDRNEADGFDRRSRCANSAGPVCPFPRT